MPAVRSPDGSWLGGGNGEMSGLEYALIESLPPLWDWSARNEQPADSSHEETTRPVVDFPKVGAPRQYDPAADDAYLAEYNVRPAGETAQIFEARRGDEPGTVERTQARARSRPK
jgi:hypothetical protein